MKKSKLKMCIKNRLKLFYDKGLFTTASRLQKELFEDIDKAYKK